jgi:hypothetical protein
MKGVILDIDRTLVHSVENHVVRMEPGREDKWKSMFDWFDIDTHITFLRPKVMEFIDWLFTEGYEVGIFTAGSAEYAEQIVEGLFSGRDLKFVFSEYDYNRCLDKYWRTKYIKFVAESYPLTPSGFGTAIFDSSVLQSKTAKGDGEWVIVDDASSVKRDNGDLCYKIKPFVVCFDDTFELKEDTEKDDELVKCMEWIRGRF